MRITSYSPGESNWNTGFMEFILVVFTKDQFPVESQSPPSKTTSQMYNVVSQLFKVLDSFVASIT